MYTIQHYAADVYNNSSKNVNIQAFSLQNNQKNPFQKDFGRGLCSV